MSMLMHVVDAKLGQPSQTYKHYFIERPCRILVIGERLKTRTKYQCLLKHISMGGAMLDFNANIFLPQNFFLEISGFREENGCTQVYRSGTQLGVRFNIPLTQDFVRRLIRMDFTGGTV